MATVIVAGAVANKYLNGGESWVRLSWVLGLKRLGFKVYLVEQIGRPTCVDESGGVTALESSVNLAYFIDVAEQFGLSGAAALISEGGEQVFGMTQAELLDVAGAADLLVNISGHLTWEPMMRRQQRKVYIDLDPGYTQFWHAAGKMGAHLQGHDFHFTVGENIGRPGCSIPTGDIRWRPLRRMTVLPEWSLSAEGGPGRFTTVASWRGPYGPITHDGVTYGLKVHEFRKFVTLPMRAPHSFEIALSIHPADGKDLDLLRQHGWGIVNPADVAATPRDFRRYVQSSGAEFSVAQGIYVDTGSGWFSDRTVRYLASGKPALVQDTGFSRNYPVGEGLVPFRTLDEAIAGADQIARDYMRHSRAARALAEDYFDSDTVLARFVDEVGVAP